MDDFATAMLRAEGKDECRGVFLPKMPLLFLQHLSLQGSSSPRQGGAALSVLLGLKDGGTAMQRTRGREVIDYNHR